MPAQEEFFLSHCWPGADACKVLPVEPGGLQSQFSQQRSLPFIKFAGANARLLGMNGRMRLTLILLLLLALHAPAVALAQEPASLPLIVVPVHVHFVRSAQHPELHATFAEAEVREVFAEVNRIWAPAGIRFEVAGVSEMQALSVPRKRLFQRSRNWVKSALPQDKLKPGLLDVCFIHEMGPNGFFYGEPVVVSETPDSTRVRGGSDHPVGRVAAHELGHALTLQHRDDRKCLMAPGLRGVLLNQEEIHAARQRALQLSVPSQNAAVPAP